MGPIDTLKAAVRAGQDAATEGVANRVARGTAEGPPPKKPEPAPAQADIRFDTPNPERERKRQAGPPAAMLEKYKNGGVVASKVSTKRPWG
jgi:hypothetical protein